MLSNDGERRSLSVMRTRSPAANEASGLAPSAAWPRYRENLARDLLAISDDLEARVMNELARERGYAGLSSRIGPFLSVVWQDGRTLASIADELAISPQAASQLANRIEAAGYLDRRPNPADRRSKLVSLTRRGRRLVEEGVEIILESEAKYEVLVGPRAYGSLTARLVDLYLGFGLPMHVDPSFVRTASRSIGVLPLIGARIRQILMATTIERGHTGLKGAHDPLLSRIGPEGAKIHELASAMGVSRQAISATARDLEKLGYLERDADLHDKRSSVLRLSSRGEALIADSVLAVDELGARLRELLGARKLAVLERSARALAGALAKAETGAAPQPLPSGQDIEGLADALRRRLGPGAAERLGALLAQGAEGTPS